MIVATYTAYYHLVNLSINISCLTTDHLHRINVGAKKESQYRMHFNINNGKAAEMIKFISSIKTTLEI